MYEFTDTRTINLDFYTHRSPIALTAMKSGVLLEITSGVITSLLIDTAVIKLNADPVMSFGAKSAISLLVLYLSDIRINSHKKNHLTASEDFYTMKNRDYISYINRTVYCQFSGTFLKGLQVGFLGALTASMMYQVVS